MRKIVLKKILAKKITLIILVSILASSIIILSLLSLSKASNSLVIVSPELVQTKSEDNLFSAKVENKTGKEFRNVEVIVSLLDDNNNVFDKASITKDILTGNEAWSFSLSVSKKAVDFRTEVTSD